MMFLGENNDDAMKFFGKSKIECSNLCHHYSANKTVTSQGIVDKFKCNTCNKYLFPGGIQNSRRNKKCRCCGGNLVYIKTISDDSDLKESGKTTISHSFTRDTFGMKTFSEFLDFIEDEMHLQANYQLVVLKFLIGHKIATTYEIAEELAYQNNKDFNDADIVKQFFHVPVFDVLEKKNLIKKIPHNGENSYLLNIQMNNLEPDNALEILEKKLKEYNMEHGLSENQFDSLSNIRSSKMINSSTEDNKMTSKNISEESLKIESDSNELNNEKIVFLENLPNGIVIKKYVEIKSEEIHKGQVLSNNDLMKKFGVGNMGGIRHSKKNNLLVLCSSLSNDYDDSFDPDLGLIVYSGEGKTGDQEISKGNAKILDSKNKMLFFKEKFQESGVRKRGALDNLYEFIGIVNYVKYYWIDEQDKEGNQRKVMKFVLEVEE